MQSCPELPRCVFVNLPVFRNDNSVLAAGAFPGNESIQDVVKKLSGVPLEGMALAAATGADGALEKTLGGNILEIRYEELATRQVREAVYTSSVSGWKRYEKYVQPLLVHFRVNGYGM